MNRYLVWHRLKENGGGGNFFLVRHKPMGQVATVREIETHDPPMRLHYRCVHSKVGR